MKQFTTMRFAAAILATCCWCDANAHAETPTPTPTPAPAVQTAIENDEGLEAQSSFEAVVVFEGDVDFTVTTADRNARQVLFEQSKYRRDGSLQNETNYFYNADGALLQTMHIAFDAQSRFTEYSIRDAQGKALKTVRLARNVKSNTKPKTVTKTNAALTIIAKPPSQIEGFDFDGDGTKIVWKLRADGTLQSKSIVRAPIGNLGAINFVSQYDGRGLRRDMSAFLRDGTRRSHVVFVRDAAGKLSEAQYAGAENGTRYSYDKNGRLTETRFLQDGKTTRRFVMRSTQTGKIGEMLFYDAQGLTSRESLARDSKDRLVSASVFDGKNALQQKTTFKYSAQSRQIQRETRDAKGVLRSRETSEYRDGKLLKVVTTNSDGTTMIDNYDAKGERVKAGTVVPKGE